jgi:peptide/nickel transport system substrate-binding protein
VRTNAGTNQILYSNPRVDDLLDRARTITSQTERKALYHQLQPILIEDTPDVFLHDDAALKAMTKSLRGFEPAADTHVRFERLWLEK